MLNSTSITLHQTNRLLDWCRCLDFSNNYAMRTSQVVTVFGGSSITKRFEADV